MGRLTTPCVLRLRRSVSMAVRRRGVRPLATGHDLLTCRLFGCADHGSLAKEMIDPV